MNRKPSTPQSSDWRSSPALMYFVVACVFSAVVLLGAWATMAAMLRWQWKETLDAEMRQNTNTALALKEHTLRILDTVDQAMWRLQHTAEDGPLNGEDLATIANETGMVPHILTQLSFVGPDGRFQGSNLDPDGSRSNHVSLMDRDHIRVHLLPAEAAPPSSGMLHNGLFISKSLLGKVSGYRPSSSHARSRPLMGASWGWWWRHSIHAISPTCTGACNWAATAVWDLRGLTE